MNDNEKEKKEIVITGKTVLRVVSAISAAIGFAMLATNLLGFTEISWFIVAPLFITPILTYIAST